jgi:hypothetical protein
MVPLGAGMDEKLTDSESNASGQFPEERHLHMTSLRRCQLKEPVESTLIPLVRSSTLSAARRIMRNRYGLAEILLLTFKCFGSTRIHDLYIYSPGRIVLGFDGIEKILSPKIRVCALQK